MDDMIKTLKSIKMRLIYIHEISEGCVRIAVPAVSNFKFVTPMIFLLDLFSTEDKLILQNNLKTDFN